MTTVERPTFSEGQILAAADLEAALSHGRASLARHERYQHTPGIVVGLELTGEDKTTDGGEPYQDVTLGSGVAVDGSGRQIVVPEAMALVPDEFAQVNGTGSADPATSWFPIFVQGYDVEKPPTEAFGASACGSTSSPTRVSEMTTIVYGRLGDAASLPDQFEGSVADGPPRNSGRILVGFVRWDDGLERFAEVSTEPKDGVPVNRAGAAADEVAARSGQLELRTGLGRTADTPAVRLDAGEGGRLAFGHIDETGGLSEVFAVDATGNITAAGSLSEGTLITGSAHVESGIAFDGVVLPLPSGVSQQQVDDGTVTVHIQITPLIPATPTPVGDHVEVVVESEVDESRQIRSRTRWIRVDGAATTEVARSAACRYLVIAAVAATGGA